MPSTCHSERRWTSTTSAFQRDIKITRRSASGGAWCDVAGNLYIEFTSGWDETQGATQSGLWQESRAFDTTDDRPSRGRRGPAFCALPAAARAGGATPCTDTVRLTG